MTFYCIYLENCLHKDCLSIIRICHDFHSVVHPDDTFPYVITIMLQAESVFEPETSDAIFMNLIPF